MDQQSTQSYVPLYTIAGICSLIIALLIPISGAVYLLDPPPVTVQGLFALYQQSPLRGMLSMDLVLSLIQLIMIPMFFALYKALKPYGATTMLLATVFFLLSLLLYFFSREIMYTMLALSNQYAAATTDIERNTLLAAGQTLLAMYNGTSFHASYIIGQAAGIAISIVMLRHKAFSKGGAWAGIIGNIVGYGLYVPVVGVYISLFSVIGLEIWYIMVGIRLLKCRRSL